MPLPLVNMTLRKVTRNHRIFPSDEAVYKVVYLAIRNIAVARGRCPSVTGSQLSIALPSNLRVAFSHEQAGAGSSPDLFRLCLSARCILIDERPFTVEFRWQEELARKEDSKKGARYVCSCPAIQGSTRCLR
jgi:hypothetical protein